MRLRNILDEKMTLNESFCNCIKVSLTMGGCIEQAFFEKKINNTGHDITSYG